MGFLTILVLVCMVFATFYLLFASSLSYCLHMPTQYILYLSCVSTIYIAGHNRILPAYFCRSVDSVSTDRQNGNSNRSRTQCFHACSSRQRGFWTNGCRDFRSGSGSGQSTVCFAQPYLIEAPPGSTKPASRRKHKITPLYSTFPHLHQIRLRAQGF